MTDFRRVVRVAASFGVTALLTLGLVSTGAQFSPAANADPPSCADATSSAPSGPATVSATTTAYGKVLVRDRAATPAAPCTCSRRTRCMR